MAQRKLGIRPLYRHVRDLASTAAPLLFLAFALLLALRYADEIWSAWPFFWGWGPVRLHAVEFWALVVLAGVYLHFYRGPGHTEHLVALTEIETRTNALYKLAEKTAKQTRHMPPRDFEQKWFESTRRVRSLQLEIAAGRAPTHPNFAYEAVQFVLFHIAYLARIFDDALPGTVYGANLMRYRPCDTIPEIEIGAVNARLDFRETGVDVRQLRGVLDLDVRLSSSADGNLPPSKPEDASHDLLLLKSFALPIPNAADQRSRDGKQKFLPGAPALFEIRKRQPWETETWPRVEYWSDTHTLGEHCEREGEFSRAVTSRLNKYFQEETAGSIRSFVSLEMKRESESVPWGVLNIHRSKSPDILTDQEIAELFFLKISDLLSVLWSVIDLVDAPRKS